MANKLIKQPDILSLDTLGSFMDAQNDPIAPAIEEKVVTNAEETASEVDSEEVVQNVVQEDSSEISQVDTTPQKPKLIFVPNLVIRTRGTAMELQTWKKTDEALAQAGGIVTPMVADRADIARYNSFGNTKIQAECVAPAFDMIYNELQKLE